MQFTLDQENDGLALRCAGRLLLRHAAQEVRQLRLAPEEGDPGLLEGRGRRGRGDRRLALGPQFRDPVDHARATLPPTSYRAIVAAIAALDYPRAKLDVKLILEADDRDTREAVGQ